MTALPEIVFASADPATSRKINNWVREGLLVQLVPRAYTSNFEDPAKDIVKRNLWHLLSNLFPGLLVSHRTALEHTPSPSGSVYLTSSTRRVLEWPGVRIRIAKGHEPLESDSKYYGELYASSLERACLENLTVSRLVDGERRTVDQAIIEARLLDILNTRGEDELNTLRDRARTISEELGMSSSFDRLNKIVSVILTTQSVKTLKSRQARAKALGEPYDSGRVDLFNSLASELRKTTFPDNPTKTSTNRAYSNFAFFEAYFSNYIEGTTFLVEEAVDIIFKHKIIPQRSADAHDIRGTFEICGNKDQMRIVPTSAKELVDLLRKRHKIILGGRPEKEPGAFKSKPNRAGDTVFVEPQFVIGTQKMGFEIYQSLQDPTARAMFIMFMISEIHPFVDGNGRIARIMMNSELVRSGVSQIIIPTVFRDDYLLGLRGLSRQRDPKIYIQVLIKAHTFSHGLDPHDFNTLQSQLEKSNAFKEPDEDMSVLQIN